LYAFEYAVAITNKAMSNPTRVYENDGYQYILRIAFFSEWVYSEWDAPGLLEEILNTKSGYAEMRWDFIPGWYIAGRVDYMGFSTIEDTRTASSAGGEKIHWDVPFVRIEPGLAWRFRREAMIKGVYQHTEYSETLREDIDLFALQLHMVFIVDAHVHQSITKGITGETPLRNQGSIRMRFG